MFYLPGSTAYSVSRWSVRNFTGLLRAELRGTGVNASLVMAGKVGDTEYFQTNTGSESRIPSIDKYYPTLSSLEVAKGIIKAIEKNKKMVIQPWLMWLTFKLQPFMPNLLQYLVNTTGWKYKP